MPAILCAWTISPAKPMSARPAQHLREIALCIGVDQQDFFTLPRKTNAEAGGCGGLTHAALLICQCDCFQWDTSSNKKGALRPLFWQSCCFLQLFFFRVVFFLFSVLLYLSLIRFRFSKVKKFENWKSQKRRLRLHLWFSKIESLDFRFIQDISPAKFFT